MTTIPCVHPPGPDSYGQSLATVYDFLATVYSAGAIDACKGWGASHIQPPASALFVGAGSAAEAIDPARRGVRCHIVDNSASMLGRAQRRFAREGLAHDTSFSLADARRLHAPDQYDAVVANFFLNTFDQHSLRDVLQRLLTYIRPGGLLVVADFVAPSHDTDDSHTTECWQAFYHDIPMHLFARWTASQRHPIHDIPAVARQAGANLVMTQHFRIGRIGPSWFGSWIFSP